MTLENTIREEHRSLGDYLSRANKMAVNNPEGAEELLECARLTEQKIKELEAQNV